MPAALLNRFQVATKAIPDGRSPSMQIVFRKNYLIKLMELTSEAVACTIQDWVGHLINISIKLTFHLQTFLFQRSIPRFWVCPDNKSTLGDDISPIKACCCLFCHSVALLIISMIRKLSSQNIIVLQNNYPANWMHIERVEWVTSGCLVLHYSCEVLFYESSILCSEEVPLCSQWNCSKIHKEISRIRRIQNSNSLKYPNAFLEARSAKLVRFKILIVICSFCRHCFTNLEQTLQR